MVLVNGMPAAGKSTLAPPLAAELGLPLFSKDVIKETHADILGVEPPPGRTQRDWSGLFGAAAGETMWALLSYASRGAVLESSWRADVRSLAAAGLARAGASRVIEIWCDVPNELARQRDRERIPRRHPIHGPFMPAETWAGMVSNAEPLALGPVLRVDTTKPVDVPALAVQVTSEAARLNSTSRHSPAS